MSTGPREVGTRGLLAVFFRMRKIGVIDSNVHQLGLISANIATQPGTLNALKAAKTSPALNGEQCRLIRHREHSRVSRRLFGKVSGRARTSTSAGGHGGGLV